MSEITIRIEQRPDKSEGSNEQWTLQNPNVLTLYEIESRTPVGTATTVREGTSRRFDVRDPWILNHFEGTLIYESPVIRIDNTGSKPKISLNSKIHPENPVTITGKSKDKGLTPCGRVIISRVE